MFPTVSSTFHVARAAGLVGGGRAETIAEARARRDAAKLYYESAPTFGITTAITALMALAAVAWRRA